MGTNYYLLPSAPCPHCGRRDESRHIGKSSAGWAFSLHVYPDEGIEDLGDWKRLWAAPGAQIENEYGDAVSVEAMEKCITVRSWPQGLNYSTIDGRHCIGHGDGTWSLCVGEFS